MILPSRRKSHPIQSQLNTMVQLDARPIEDQEVTGSTPPGRQHSFMEIDHEIFSMVIISLSLIQEGQLSVSGKRMRSILVNRLTNIPKTCIYNFDPLKPPFYIIKLEFTGVYIIFLISAKKHRLWVLVRTASTRRF